MIIAAGLTPAWQTVMRFGSFVPGEVNRAYEVERSASGKVLNVAVALAHLDAPCKAIALVGGPPRELIDRELSSLGISRHWITANSATRSCLTILDDATGKATELVENAGPVTPKELDEFHAVFVHDAVHADVVVLTGSLPTGTPTTFYKDLLSEVRCPVVLDARGPELLEALEHRPFLVKPNREELSTTMGRPLSSDADVRNAMAELVDRGAHWVLVSNGSQPAWIGGEGKFYQIAPAPVKRVLNPIGSGDCLAAGVAWALSKGESPLDVFAYGMAAAASNLSHVLAGRISLPAVACNFREVLVTTR